MFHLFESCFKSVKHRIAFFTSTTCFKIIQPVCCGGSDEQDVDTWRLAVSLSKPGVGHPALHTAVYRVCLTKHSHPAAVLAGDPTRAFPQDPRLPHPHSAAPASGPWPGRQFRTRHITCLSRGAFVAVACGRSFCPISQMSPGRPHSFPRAVPSSTVGLCLQRCALHPPQWPPLWVHGVHGGRLGRAGGQRRAGRALHRPHV